MADVRIIKDVALKGRFVECARIKSTRARDADNVCPELKNRVDSLYYPTGYVPLDGN
jgi:hypothetical protein